MPGLRTLMGVTAQAAGERRHLVRLEFIGPPVSDGDGGFTNRPRGLCPSEVFASIEPATARVLERLAAGTVISNASHIVTLPYHPGVTTKTQIKFGDRTMQVTGVANPEERGLVTVCICTEIVQ